MNSTIHTSLLLQGIAKMSDLKYISEKNKKSEVNAEAITFSL